MRPEGVASRVRVTETGCWEWAQVRTRDGYGSVGRPGRAAHRVVYELLVGPIPAGMEIDHQCFNPPCVNPEHLSLATRQENARRQRSALRQECVNGHAMTPDNTYLRPGSGDGRRGCRACNKEAVRRYKQRKRGMAA